jgi:hypothetical protein
MQYPEIRGKPAKIIMLRIDGLPNGKDVPNIECREDFCLRFYCDVEEKTILGVNSKDEMLRRRPNESCECAIFSQKRREVLLQSGQCRADKRPGGDFYKFRDGIV